MKTYLHFSIEGEISELKTKDKTLIKENYSDYKFSESVTYNKNKFVLLFNKNSKDKINITSLPFYKETILGSFLLFLLEHEQDNELKSFTENKFLKLINISQKKVEDYSSDDFNLSDE